MAGVHGNHKMGVCFCGEYGNMGIWDMSDIEYDTQLNKCYISGWDMTGAVYSYE